MDDLWRNDFSAFVASMGSCPEGLTLDRIDNNGNYAPGNCRWASKTVQSRNRRCVHMVRWDGRMMALSEAFELAGVNYDRAYHQVIRRGRSVEEAIEYVQNRLKSRIGPLPQRDAVSDPS